MKLKDAKAKGSRRERQSIALLEAAGYRCIKSGGSLSEWDVLGLGPEGAVACQVKSNRLPSPAERATLRASCPYPYVTRLIHVWRDRARVPRVIEL